MHEMSGKFKKNDTKMCVRDWIFERTVNEKPIFVCYFFFVSVNSTHLDEDNWMKVRFLSKRQTIKMVASFRTSPRHWHPQYLHIGWNEWQQAFIIIHSKIWSSNFRWWHIWISTVCVRVVLLCFTLPYTYCHLIRFMNSCDVRLKIHSVGNDQRWTMITCILHTSSTM